MSKTKQYLFEYICSAEYEDQLIQQKYLGFKQPRSNLEGVKQGKQGQSIASLRSSLQKRFKRV